MKKKHFLFTSLAIAAILSANVVQAEENTSSVNELDKELVTGDGVSVALENLLETETGEATSNQASSGLESEGEAEEPSLLADDSATRSEVTTRSASTPSLDDEALKAGDYSSVHGTWESVSGAGSVTFGESNFEQFKDLPLGESKDLPDLGNDKVYPVYVERRITEDGHVENITATSSGRTIDWKFVPKGTTYSLEWKKAENLQVAEEDLVLGRMNGEFKYSAYRRSATSPEIHHELESETKTGMLVENINLGDYSSVKGIWNKVNDAQGQPEFIRITDNGFFSAPELNFKAVKLGEVKEVPNRYKWGRMIATSQGYPTDWIGYHNSEGINVTYVPKGGAYSLWDVNLGKSVEKIAAEDIIISRGLGYEAVYARARSVDQFYDVTAGDYGMGTLVDSLGRSIVDNKAVVVTGQLGDTIDLNAVGGRFGREGKAIYRVTLSNGKDELTLPDYQSSFVIDETTKAYTKLTIVYDSLMPKPKPEKEGQNESPMVTSKTINLVGRGDITVSGLPSGAQVDVQLLPQVLRQWELLADARKNQADFSEWTLVKVTDKDGNPYQGEVALTYPIDGRLNRRVSDVVFLKDGETKATNHAFTTKDGYVTVVLPVNGILEVAYLNGVDKTDKNTPGNQSQNQQSFTAEQELIARVWKTVTGGEYPYSAVRREAGHPINYFNGIGHVFPKVTYSISENSNRPYAWSHYVNFSDNGDGTVTIYKVPKHWHMETLEEVVKYTQTILDTAQIITLDQLTKEETATIIGRATGYTGFTTGSDTQNDTLTPQPDSRDHQREDLAGQRNKLLAQLDQSDLSDEQKGQLAEKFAFATTEKELADVKAEFDRLVASVTKPKGSTIKKETPKTATAKATLPTTGDQSPAIWLTAGIGFLLASLGLTFYRRHR